MIVLTTDFGTDDVFVGVMKGVILSINPVAKIVDLTHAIAPFGVVEAAYKIEQASPYFPPGTIHVVVVDPGVGSERRAIAVRSGSSIFLAPDNGVLTCVLQHGMEEAVELRERRYWLSNVSPTFHGRDLFAPVAAHISRGVALADLGPPARDLVTIPLPEPQIMPDGSIIGTVLWVDRFGNLISNVPRAMASAGNWRVAINEIVLGQVRRTYSDVPAGEPVAIIGSFGHLEIAVREGSAASRFSAGPGSPVRLLPAVRE